MEELRRNPAPVDKCFIPIAWMGFNQQLVQDFAGPSTVFHGDRMGMAHGMNGE